MNGNVAGSNYDHPTEEAWAKISSSFQAPTTNNNSGGSSKSSISKIETFLFRHFDPSR